MPASPRGPCRTPGTAPASIRPGADHPRRVGRAGRRSSRPRPWTRSPGCPRPPPNSLEWSDAAARRRRAHAAPHYVHPDLRHRTARSARIRAYVIADPAPPDLRDARLPMARLQAFFAAPRDRSPSPRLTSSPQEASDAPCSIAGAALVVALRRTRRGRRVPDHARRRIYAMDRCLAATGPASRLRKRHRRRATTGRDGVLGRVDRDGRRRPRVAQRNEQRRILDAAEIPALAALGVIARASRLTPPRHALGPATDPARPRPDGALVWEELGSRPRMATAPTSYREQPDPLPGSTGGTP